MTIDSADFLDLYISLDGNSWTHAQQGIPMIDGMDFFDLEKSYFFRDANYHYAFLGYEGFYKSPIDEIAWSPISAPQTGNDWIIHNNVLYLGDHGMDKTDIEHPYITSITNPPDYSKSPIRFKVTPTLANNTISISSLENVHEDALLQIFSADGKLVLSSIFHEPSTEINIQSFVAGVYYVVIFGRKKVELHPFLKS